jgi:radical SAM superfamily enzyme YgiQ (UPF0313 family)
VDLVGISVMSNFVGRARSLTQAIQQRLSVPVLWGGIHPTVKPAECLAWADLVCVGEGEQAMLELVSRLASGQGYADVPNICFQDKAGRVVANPVRPLNRSLDDLPFPDYGLEGQYVLHQDQVRPLTSELLSHYLLNHFVGQTLVVYMTCMTRGCPHQCAYCCSSALGQVYPDWNKLRRHSPEYTVAEIEAAVRQIPSIQAVMFLDDAFLAASNDAIRRFSGLYRERVGLPFQMMATPGSINEEKISCLVEAGLRDVEMGIQTGSQRIRALYSRQGDNQRVLKAARCLNRFCAALPRPRYDVISDNPYETRDDQLAMLRLLYQLPRPFVLYIFSLAFFPGAELYRRATMDGIIQDEERQVYPKNIVQPRPSYYNFVLWCLHRNWPRWLLWPLIQPLALRAFGSARLEWLFRALWRAINAYRTRHARRQHLEHKALLKGGENVTP